MRFDRRRTRGVAVVLMVVVMVVAGAGGGIAVADHGPPADTQPQSFQSDDATANDSDGDSAADAGGDSEGQTEAGQTESSTPEPVETTADETAASGEPVTATETSSTTDTPASTPESSDGSTAEDSGASSEETGGSDASTDGELTSCTEITAAGEYELTADVEGSGTCIVVQSSGVVLNGNGHTVAGSGSGTGIQVAGGVSDVTVRNVDAVNWGVAVALGGTGASGLTANLVEVRATGSDTGVRLVEADGSAMQAVTARDNGDGVVLADTAGVQASDVTVAGNDGTGLWLARGVSDSSFSIVQATDNGERGIHVATGAVDNFVGDATVTDNSGAGVEFADSSNNVLADSRVERNGGPGVLSYPAGGDRLENVQLSDNADGAYRDRGERAGAVADTVQLRDGASVRFDQGVTHLTAAGVPGSVPEGTAVAGPAVDVTLRDGSTATVTVPVDGSGDVTAYQRVDGGWAELGDVTVTNGEAEMTVTGSGVVVPVVETTDDETTETGVGDDTVRADASSDAGPAAGDESASGDDSASSAESTSTDGDVANDGSVSGEESTADAATSGPADSGASEPDAATGQYSLGDDGAPDAGTTDAAADDGESEVHRLVIESAASDAATDYTLQVDGNVSKVTDGTVTADANDTVSRANGTATVDGTTATADAYLVEGQLRGVCGTVGSPGYALRYDDVSSNQ